MSNLTRRKSTAPSEAAMSTMQMPMKIAPRRTMVRKTPPGGRFAPPWPNVPETLCPRNLEHLLWYREFASFGGNLTAHGTSFGGCLLCPHRRAARRHLGRPGTRFRGFPGAARGRVDGASQPALRQPAARPYRSLDVRPRMAAWL